MESTKINRLKAALADSGKTGKWLAHELGKDPTTISKWCTNTIQPDLKTLAKISYLLNVDQRELLVSNKTKDGHEHTTTIRQTEKSLQGLHR